MRFTLALTIIERAVRDFIDDDAPSLAAAIAFYSMLSMAPLALLAVSVGAAVGEDAAIRSEIVGRVEERIGPHVAQLARTLLEARDAPGPRRLAVVGAGLVLFAATTVFAQIQHSLNRVWRVQVRRDRWLWPLVRKRLMSLAMILLFGLLLLTSALAGSLIGLAITRIDVTLPGGDLPWLVGGFLGSFLMKSIFLTIVFRALPDVHITWGDAARGAVLSAMMFAVGKEFMQLYLGLDALSSAYGAAGALVVLLVWVYYGSVLLLFGAEITHALARSRDRRIEPKPWAEPIPR